MRNIYPVKKQKTSSTTNYELYLSKGPEPTERLSNTYNLLDDSNATDKAMMKRVNAFTRKLGHSTKTRLVS